ncbi:MAG: helix-turn-helix domain-containing protein [Candidatus Saccharibacteria bacterium]|nr:helix-turn-helix domain-containing protein [Candidatus Saccharibacteria bacterium]
MSETTKLLRGIMKTSGWTQEQTAEKLGVSFQTMNAWVNGKSKPRTAMREKIHRLYLAQDVTKDIEPTFITLINVPRWLKIDDMVMLEKEYDNEYDDEAIIATVMEDDEDEEIYQVEYNEGVTDDADSDDGEVSEIRIYDDRRYGGIELDSMYVANSTSTVVRGTSSAGRIYDKFGRKARARILFIFHKTAIARIVEWGYAEKGE